MITVPRDPAAAAASKVKLAVDVTVTLKSVQTDTPGATEISSGVEPDAGALPASGETMDALTFVDPPDPATSQTLAGTGTLSSMSVTGPVELDVTTNFVLFGASDG
jgi:polyisoprenoid-binding protein YceI